MGYTFKLSPERCRAGTDSRGASRIEVIYQLNHRVPSGLRHRLVPALEKNLSEHQLRLISLDLFDEFIRICIPSSTPVELVEAPLQQVLGQIEPTPQEMPSELARQHLADFKKGSKHS